MAGSPPQRPPPPIDVKQTVENESCSSREMDSSNGKYGATIGDDCGLKYKVTTTSKSNGAGYVKIPPLGLPSLRTGTSHIFV